MARDTKLERQLKQELEKIEGALKKLPKSFVGTKMNRALMASGKIYRDEARSKIKDSGVTHYRYSGGKVVAEYKSGHLRKSIKTFRFKGDKNAVYVGGWFSRSKSESYDGDKRSQPYYMHLVHDGSRNNAPNPFMTTSFNAKTGQAIDLMARRATRWLKDWARKNRK